MICVMINRIHSINDFMKRAVPILHNKTNHVKPATSCTAGAADRIGA